MRINRITSPDNERIKLYRRLCTDKKLRRKEELFVLEGARLVSDAAGIIPFHSVFMTENAMQRFPEASEKICGNTDCVNIITEDIAAAMAQTDTSQQIFAVMHSPQRKSISDAAVSSNKVIILDNIQDPGNMGTILRTADACGIDTVVLCSCTDELAPKVVRSAMGSIMRICICREEYPAAVDTLRKSGFTVYASVINGGDVLGQMPFAEKSAVVIGNEGSGMPEEHIALADRRLTIRMHGRVNSLNAAMAAGIIMWELSK